MPDIAIEKILSSFFSADLRASALAMLISKTDLLPDRMIGQLSRN